MNIPDSERAHVYNVNKTALKGADTGDRVFITSASSAVMGVLTRIEKVKQIVGTSVSPFVETQTGRIFSVRTGKGVKELDKTCVACLVTPGLTKAFKELVAFRRSLKWMQTYNYGGLPPSIVLEITELVRQGEILNKSLYRGLKSRDTTLEESLAPQVDHVEVWMVGDDPVKAFKDFKLPPLTFEIQLVRRQFRAKTYYGETFNLKRSSGVVLKKLQRRTALALLTYTTRLEKRKP